MNTMDTSSTITLPTSLLTELIFGGSGIYHHILTYLSVKDVFHSYLGVNQQSCQQIKEHYLFRSIPRNKVVNGCLNDSDSQTLTVLLHLIVYSAYGIEVESFGRRGRLLVEGESNILTVTINDALVNTIVLNPSLNSHQWLKQGLPWLVSNGIGQWIAKSLRYWTSSLVDERKGIVDQIIEKLEETPITIPSDAPVDDSSETQGSNGESAPDSIDEGMKQRLMEALTNDVQHWATSRKSDSFIVLFDREDGRILVSQDLQRVYLVVDMLREEDRIPQYIEPIPFPFTLPSAPQETADAEDANDEPANVLPNEAGNEEDVHIIPAPQIVDLNELDPQSGRPSPADPNQLPHMTKSIFGNYSLSDGRLVKCTLFPYQTNLIVSSRYSLTYSAEPVTEAHMREALKAYIQAEDKGKIITTLPTWDRNNEYQEMQDFLDSDAPLYRERCRDWFATLHSYPIKTVPSTFSNYVVDDDEDVGHTDSGPRSDPTIATNTTGNVGTTSSGRSNAVTKRTPVVWGFRVAKGYTILAANPSEGRLSPQIIPSRTGYFTYPTRSETTNRIELKSEAIFTLANQNEIDDSIYDSDMVIDLLRCIVNTAQRVGYLPAALNLFTGYEGCHILALLLRSDPYLSQIRLLWDVEDIEESEYTMGMMMLCDVQFRCFECRCMTTPQGTSLSPCLVCNGRCASYYCCDEHRHECTLTTAHVPPWRRSGSTVTMSFGTPSLRFDYNPDIDDI